MSFDVSFAPSRHPVLAGCLVLALSWHSSAIAEDTFAGVIPDRRLRFPEVFQPEEVHGTHRRANVFLLRSGVLLGGKAPMCFSLRKRGT